MKLAESSSGEGDGRGFITIGPLQCINLAKTACDSHGQRARTDFVTLKDLMRLAPPTDSTKQSFCL